MSGFAARAAAGFIKSIQRGTVTATNGGSGTITISPVDPAKSVLRISYKGGRSVGGLNDFETIPAMVLTNATTLTWYGGASYSVDIHAVLYWQLQEFI